MHRQMSALCKPWSCKIGFHVYPSQWRLQLGRHPKISFVTCSPRMIFRAPFSGSGRPTWVFPCGSPCLGLVYRDTKRPPFSWGPIKEDPPDWGPPFFGSRKSPDGPIWERPAFGSLWRRWTLAVKAFGTFRRRRRKGCSWSSWHSAFGSGRLKS